MRRRGGSEGEEGQGEGMEVPWRVPGERNGVFFILPEAEGQKVRAAGIFTSAPRGRSVPLHWWGRTAAPGREEGGFVREMGWFPSPGVEMVKNKGQVLKSGRMLKSPCSPPPPPPFSSFILLPSIPFPHPPLFFSWGFSFPKDLSPGCKPGGSPFTPNLLACSMYLLPQPMSSSSSISLNSPFPAIPLTPWGVALVPYHPPPPPYMSGLMGARSWEGMLGKKIKK